MRKLAASGQGGPGVSKQPAAPGGLGRVRACNCLFGKAQILGVDEDRFTAAALRAESVALKEPVLGGSLSQGLQMKEAVRV